MYVCMLYVCMYVYIICMYVCIIPHARCTFYCTGTHVMCVYTHEGIVFAAVCYITFEGTCILLYYVVPSKVLKVCIHMHALSSINLCLHALSVHVPHLLKVHHNLLERHENLKHLFDEFSILPIFHLPPTHHSMLPYYWCWVVKML